MNIIDGNMFRKLTVRLELLFIRLMLLITFNKWGYMREMLELTERELEGIKEEEEYQKEQDKKNK